MTQFNYPTTILYGEGSLKKLAESISARGLKSCLFVTDATLVKNKLAEPLLGLLKEEGVKVTLFSDVHPNPIEDDVVKGAEVLRKNQCDHIVALGGGSPLDAAKVINIQATQKPPLIQYDDTKNGADRMDGSKLLPIFAVPTTAGTGSEVGRSGVIIMKDTGAKTIFFHPRLLPVIAALEPQLTEKLPPHLTAATGLDAFTHCLEAFLAPGFHPMADGIALEGIRLILKSLPQAVKVGSDLEARGVMQVAAAMGATAFQKGLGMIHSMAHPLSSECGLHHGLANALVMPESLSFIEGSCLNPEQKDRLHRVVNIFKDLGLAKGSLAESVRGFVVGLGVDLGLSKHGVKADDLDMLSEKAFLDVCHQSNVISVTQKDFLKVLRAAF